jgi:glutamate/tyrosine decarboxylase-like PLP-dependent enzyme
MMVGHAVKWQSNEHPLRDRGLELADSVTIDPHKWFYAPMDAGALLVKDETRLTASEVESWIAL